MDLIMKTEHLGQVRGRVYKGELLINISDLGMWLEVRAHREDDPDAERALNDAAKLLFETARRRG